MPVLSSTAPVITPEFEQQERAALSEEELRAIDDEMHGRASNLLPESEEMRQSAAALLHEELLGIPDREKLAYLEALERNAEVVDRETDPVAFMRCERYNPGAAARRVVEYWKLRRRLFGTKAFEPMTLEGAMSEDLESLNKQIAAILPDDEHGRPVWFVDRIRAIPEEVSRQSLMRVQFYVLQVLSKKKRAQTEGIIFNINLMGFSPMVHFDRIETKTLYKLMDDTMPTKMIAVHAFVGRSTPAVSKCRSPARPEEKDFVKRCLLTSDPFTVVRCCGNEPMASGVSCIDMVMPLIKQIGGKRFRLRHRLHTGTYEQMLSQLGPFGLVKENLCNVIGGALSPMDCQALLDEVIRESTVT